MNALEKAVQRKATKAFIDADPTTLVLKTKLESFVGGTKKIVDGPESPPQVFKVIWEGQSGINREAPNGARRFDFVLIGEHDAVISIGDFWKDGEQENRITWVSPSNEYEVVAGGISHGPSPT